MKTRRWIAALFSSALLFFCFSVPVAAISSQSAAVYEPESGRFLWEKDAETKRPMASTTKLMTALLTAERLDGNRIITVPQAALPVEGTQVGLTAGDTVSVRDLLACLLLSSGNDAANVLALSVAENFSAFADLMNERAASLGMIGSHFVTPSGLDADGHGSTARDMALLGAQVLTVPLLADLCASQTATVSVSGASRVLKNHNKLLRLYEGCVGLKTGFTKKSGRCLVSAATKNGVTLVIATLNGGDDWNDHIRLYNETFLRVRRELMPCVDLSAMSVIGGLEDTVALTMDTPPSCVMTDDETVTAFAELPSFVWAPMDAGETVGEVVYTAGERELARVPIKTAQAVVQRDVPSFSKLVWRRLGCLIRGLLS